VLTALAHAVLRAYGRRTARDLRPHLAGRRVLDLGGGEGFVAEALRRQPSAPWVCGADIGAFRRVPGPYVVYDGARLPFRDATFDTTLLLLTLHHCRDAGTVLAEAVRVTRRRLLLTESVYRNRAERWWLLALDGPFNGRRHGGAMSRALDVRPPEAWRHALQAQGLTVSATAWLGPWWERLVHHPLLFVLDAPGRT
jgi:SAM-dependent methyltransferase